MNTYYDIRLTAEQRNALMLASGYTKDTAECEPFIFSEEELNLVEPMKQAHKLLEKAVPHPNIEDVYQHEAEHSGFKEGEVVLVEGIVRTNVTSKRLSSQHLPVLINDYMQGAVEVNPHISTIYHKD